MYTGKISPTNGNKTSISKSMFCIIFLIDPFVRISLILSQRIHSSEYVQTGDPFSIKGMQPAKFAESAKPTHLIKFAPLSVSMSRARASDCENRSRRLIDSLKVGLILKSLIGMESNVSNLLSFRALVKSNKTKAV